MGSASDFAPNPDANASMSGGSGKAAVEIGQLVREYHAIIYRYAFRLSGSAQDAEDLAQQTFLQAHEKLHQLREPERVRGWLFTILRTTFLKQCRQRKLEPASSVELPIDEIPEDTDEDWLDEQALQSALDELPAEARLVLTMFYFEQLSYKEIAAKLDIKTGTVMSRLARAKSKLRAKLLAHHQFSGLSRDEAAMDSLNGTGPQKKGQGE